MQDEMTPGGEMRHETDSHESDPSRALPVPRVETLPRETSGRSGRSELRQIGNLLEEAAGLTLDVLDIVGDAIGERLGLGGRSRRVQPDAQ